MSFPLPEPTPLSQPYWDALKAGRLTFQRCRKCSHAWLPPRAECPECLAGEPEWTEASGKGRVISWVIYHHAYHEPSRRAALQRHAGELAKAASHHNSQSGFRLKAERPVKLKSRRTRLAPRACADLNFQEHKHGGCLTGTSRALAAIAATMRAGAAFFAGADPHRRDPSYRPGLAFGDELARGYQRDDKRTPRAA